MANKEHLALLKEAVEKNDIQIWNQWRQAEENSGIVPDLQDSNLSGMMLSNAGLSDAKLNQANLMATNLSGAELMRADLSNSDLSGADLTRAHMHHAKLVQANLNKAVMTEVVLRDANLSSATLREAIIDYGQLDNAQFCFSDLTKSTLNGAHLRGAHFENANLETTILTGADLSESNLLKANLTKANLMGSILDNASLAGADLSGANLEQASLEYANVYSVRFDRRAKYRGIKVSTCCGSPLFKRFAQDQEFIEEFRASRWRYPAYLIWLILADCGRSLVLWTFWCVIAVLAFAWRYWSLGSESFKHTDLPWQPASAIYYSVVTFTTLGFGDISPKTIQAAMWVMAEVIIGYVMLGGLISIFANKLARRS
jgi:uncharacterized protein YjbI with pentapeptide repeats